ncbi:MAG: ATP-dependent RNA helicase DbpA [Pseudomonadota bacterium]
MSDTGFSALGLEPDVIANLGSLGYRVMTPVQAASLPHVLAGRDVIAQAKTGSGKTAAFGIGLLRKLNPRFFGVQALVLCPTRELADQVAKELRRLARHADNIKILTLCGGMPMGPQLGSLEHGAHVVVGTPGRVLKHLAKGSLVLDGLSTLVLDEADRMLDMGFRDDIVEVVAYAPPRRQTLLFSATWPAEIRELSRDFQREPVEVTVDSGQAPTQIEQYFFEVADRDRLRAAVDLLRAYVPASAVLFCNTKQRCVDLLPLLREAGFVAQALHGDLEQRERDLALVQFSNGSCPLLVATDVAARGLDIKELAAVISVDLAFDPEIHIHRIGRTGRAGQGGLALSLCSPGEAPRALAIGQYTGKPLSWRDVPPPSAARPSAPAFVTLNIAGGRKDKLRPGDILGALTGEGGLAGAKIGKIDIFDMQAYVAVDRGVADQALRALANGRIKGRSFKVRRIG